MEETVGFVPVVPSVETLVGFVLPGLPPVPPGVPDGLVGTDITVLEFVIPRGGNGKYI